MTTLGLAALLKSWNAASLKKTNYQNYPHTVKAWGIFYLTILLVITFLYKTTGIHATCIGYPINNMKTDNPMNNPMFRKGSWNNLSVWHSICI